MFVTSAISTNRILPLIYSFLLLFQLLKLLESRIKNLEVRILLHTCIETTRFKGQLSRMATVYTRTKGYQLRLSGKPLALLIRGREFESCSCQSIVKAKTKI
jgi:hypothetical protein